MSCPHPWKRLGLVNRSFPLRNLYQISNIYIWVYRIIIFFTYLIISYCNNAVKWSDHLIQHTYWFNAFLQRLQFSLKRNHPQTYDSTFNIWPTIYASYYLLLISQHYDSISKNWKSNDFYKAKSGLSWNQYFNLEARLHFVPR